MNLLKKYTNLLYWVAMFGLFLIFAYSKGWIFANFQSITAKEALTLIATDNNVSVLDVRSTQEYKRGHLSSATLLPVESLAKNIAMIKEMKGKKVLVYCATGNRSVAASRILKKYGFSPFNIKGGMIDLKANGADIIK